MNLYILIGFIIFSLPIFIACLALWFWSLTFVVHFLKETISEFTIAIKRKTDDNID